MATCDPDGTIAQALRDRHVCLSIEMHEALAVAATGVDDQLRRMGLPAVFEEKADG